MQPAWAITGLGLLMLLGLALVVPAAVILVVSPSTRPIVANGAKAMGWFALCLLLLGFFGWFVPETERAAAHSTAMSPAIPPPATVTTPAPQAGEVAVAGSSSGMTEPAIVLLAEAPPGADLLAGAGVVHRRPTWVDEPSQRRDQTYRTEVKSGLYVTPAECQRALDVAITRAVEQYVGAYFGDERASQAIELSPEYLRQRLIKQPLYAETVESSVGSMLQLHALLEFDDAVRADMHRLWRQAFVFDRLRYAGAAFGLVVGVLTAALAYLKLSGGAAVGGRRLRWGTAGAILLVAASAAGLCIL